MIKITPAVLALSLVTLPAMAEFDLPTLDSDSTNSMLNSAASLSQTQNSAVVGDLVDNLSITPEQATTGAGALLSLAQNSLGSGQASELSSLIPGMSSLSSSGLLTSVENMESVKNIFASVGLDPSMISQFAPVVLDYLGTQGASSELLGSLTSLWQ
ncbi:hypothetical protein BCU70_11550 [Vibrio sp. 10N.286.49.C2]|uniref:DUF2780 domain-containing protein n=1 Tax=unclassified Vibrio TaxID=2614977 RepID=UPI000CA8B503|nr:MULTISPECIES: DUF2780 domain-containing protein [unclassified Vibrio]PMH40170.1 hypothetical protein BCU70_11550 [Vibrio sp. 10N.286.49.C2]PMH46377.1 hypothetical protein BCU66_01540 [Vibrio sp. 10N.286.49.B1]PMH81875.1 hypothetical protein BCU58_20215 [Vibrio sp. 10N.286.48.B7]